MAGVAEGHVTSKAAGYYHCFIIYQNHFTSKRPGSLCSCSLSTPCLARQRPPANHTACQLGKGNHKQVGQSPQGRAFFLSQWPETKGQKCQSVTDISRRLRSLWRISERVSSQNERITGDSIREHKQKVLTF